MDLNKPSSASDSVLLVRCETWREFAEFYANDIGNGGMFVATEHQPVALSTIEVHLQLPEATEIVLSARVVQVVGASQAVALGKPPGIGLELLDMDAERKKQVYQLVEFARWQGATDDPNTSFARTLLELSPSLPPAEVGHRLSLMPGPARPSDSSSAIRRAGDSSSGVPRAGTAAGANGRASDSSANHRVQRSAAPNATSQNPQARASGRAASISTTTTRSAQPPEPEAAAPAAPATPPKPTDPVKLKLVLTEFAHKHYDAALRTTREMLDANPGDPGALRWQHMCNARLALARNDAATALTCYDQALQYDEDNREAREYVRNMRRDQKLNSLPFGRYFTKKK